MSPTKPKSLTPLSWNLVVTTALAGAIVAGMFWLIARKQSEEDWVRHTLAVRNQMANVLILAQRTETGQRGYLLTPRRISPTLQRSRRRTHLRRSTSSRRWLVIIHGNGRLWKTLARSLPRS